MTNILNRPVESALMSTYSRSDLAFVKGKGVWLFDKKAKCFGSCLWIAVNFGSQPPKVGKSAGRSGSNSGAIKFVYGTKSEDGSLLTKTLCRESFYKLRSWECRGAIKIARDFFSSGQLSKTNNFLQRVLSWKNYGIISLLVVKSYWKVLAKAAWFWHGKKFISWKCRKKYRNEHVQYLLSQYLEEGL